MCQSGPTFYSQIGSEMFSRFSNKNPNIQMDIQIYYINSRTSIDLINFPRQYLTFLCYISICVNLHTHITVHYDNIRTRISLDKPAISRLLALQISSDNAILINIVNSERN